MEPVQSPKIFDGLRFYMQSVGVDLAKRAELVRKLKTSGAVEITKPDDLTCKAIFVFAGKPLRRYKSLNKAKSLDSCQQTNSWTFHDLCQHFGRVEGDKIKNKQYVVDYTWIDESIVLGKSDQSNRWQRKEIMVKKQIANLQVAAAGLNSAAPLTPKSLEATPIDSPVIQPSDVPATSGSVAVKAIIDTSATSPPKLLSSFTAMSKSFHVFPRNMKTFVEITIIASHYIATAVESKADDQHHGGVVDALERADIVLVNDSDGSPATLKEHQKAISLDWLTVSVDLGEVQAFEHYLVRSKAKEAVIDTSKEVKPTIPEEVGIPASAIQTHTTMVQPENQAHTTMVQQENQAQPTSKGRKRAATFSSGAQPASKINRPGTSQRPRRSVPTVSSSAVFIPPSTPALAPLPRCFAPRGSFPKPTPAEVLVRDRLKNERQQRLLAHIVDELDGWCKAKSPGSRSSFLEAAQEKSEPDFGRLAFFTNNKQAILRALSERGRDVRIGTKVYGRPHDGKWPLLPDDGEDTSHDCDQAPQRDDFDRPSAPGSPPQSSDTGLEATPIESESEAASRSITIRPRSMSVAYIGSGARTSGALTTLPSAQHNSSTAAQQTQRPVTSGLGPKYWSHKLAVDRIVQELHEWCVKGSKGTRTTYLKGINKAKPGHDRISFFKRHREEILNRLSDLEHDVGEGSKLYGTGAGAAQLGVAKKKELSLDPECSTSCPTSARSADSDANPKPTASSSRSSVTIVKSATAGPIVAAAPTFTDACATSNDHSIPFPLNWGSTTRYD